MPLFSVSSLFRPDREVTILPCRRVMIHDDNPLILCSDKIKSVHEWADKTRTAPPWYITPGYERYFLRIS
ncbi:MAG: hypothetical protein D3910_06560 [Candidatus Electrothrix sp. ATG2]|nr:hypothetical protein [Candidatus Electrothrix sp. ATG2]